MKDMRSKQGRTTGSWLRRLSWLLIGGVLFVGLSVMIGHTVPVGVDFGNTFYAVGRAIMNGQSPYSVKTFLSPPWVLILVAPLGILPIQWAWGVFTLTGLGVYLIAFIRLRLPLIVLALFMLSPFVWFNLYYGNIDWLILLGVTLPPQWGVWLLMIKPQMSVGLIALWAFRLWRAQGVKAVLRIFALPVAVGSLSFLVGLWNAPDLTPREWWTSAWPVGLPVGGLLVWLAFARDEVPLALAASPFLSPYVAVHSWLVTLMPFAQRKRLLVFFILLAWGAVLIRYWPVS